MGEGRRIVGLEAFNASDLGAFIQSPLQARGAMEAPGELWICGTFSGTKDGTPFYRLAYWDGADWSFLSPSAPSVAIVWDVTRFEGVIYAATSSGIYEWTGSAWSLMRSGNTRRFAIYQDNLYAVQSTAIRKFNGSSWPIWSTTNGTNQTLWADENDLYVGGSFDQVNLVGDSPMDSIGVAIWDGGAWITPADNPLFGTVYEGRTVNGTAYAVGSIDNCGFEADCAENVAYRTPPGLFVGWGAGNAPTVNIRDICGLGSDVYALGGSSKSLWRYRGGSWSDLSKNHNGSGYAAVEFDSKAWFGGTFTTFDGVSAKRVCTFDGADISAVGDTEISSGIVFNVSVIPEA